MRLEQIKYFIDVTETMSITHAANANFISPQALSSALSSLEKEIGYSLLSRSSNRISLLPEGEIFLRYAKEIVYSYTSALSDLESYFAKDKALNGKLNIYSASNISDLILPETINYFSFRYPDIKIKVTEIDIDNILLFLQSSNEWDILFLTATESYTEQLISILSAQNINKVVLSKDEIVVCTKATDAISKAKMLSNDEIYHYLSKENLSFSLYNFIPTNDETSRLFCCSNCLTASNNASLHKMFLQQNIALPLMPFLSYKYKFQEKDFSCVKLQDATETAHIMLFKSNKLVELFVDYVVYCCSKIFVDFNEK